MVSACSRAGRGNTRRAYRAKVPKADPKAAASVHQEQKKGATLKPDQRKPAVNPPPGLECVLHAKQIEEVLDQVAPAQVCKTSAIELPPGLERVAENLPATPETADPSEVQEAISESDDVATVTENPPYPFHVKDVSECAACSGNVLAPIACCVSIEGLPNAILSEPMMLAMLQQAGLLEEVITFSTCEGDPCGEAHVSFSSVDAALRCVYHFESCQWDASGKEVIAKMTPLKSNESLESLDYALGMDAAMDYVCCSAMEGEDHLGAMTQEQASEILQDHLGAMTQEQACEILQDHLGAMIQGQACEILQEQLGTMAQEEAGEILQEHAGAMLSAEAAEFIPCDVESQQPPGVLRADAPAFEAMPSDSMVYETLLSEVYEMVDAEACDFMTVHGSDCMAAFAGEAHNTLLSADSPPFVPSSPTLAVPTKLGVSSDTSTELGESDVDDDKGGLVV